jgi:hypothetical protein
LRGAVWRQIGSAKNVSVTAFGKLLHLEIYKSCENIPVTDNDINALLVSDATGKTWRPIAIYATD